MIDIDYLSKLLPLLKAHGISSYNDSGLCIRFQKFHVEQAFITPEPTKDQLINVPVDESTLPPDLRADVLMDQDKILNWSAPNQEVQEELPLTGDSPIG